MNVIKQGMMLTIAVIMLVMLGIFNTISGIFDWLMILIITSDKLCARCGTHCDTVTHKQPLCGECRIECEDELMSRPSKMTHYDLSMYR